MRGTNSKKTKSRRGQRKVDRSKSSENKVQRRGEKHKSKTIVNADEKNREYKSRRQATISM